MLVLGGVFLCVTGAEALYADLGQVSGTSSFQSRRQPTRLSQ